MPEPVRPTRREFLRRGSAAALGASVLGGAAESAPASAGRRAPILLRAPGRSQDFSSRRPPPEWSRTHTIYCRRDPLQ